MEMGESRIHRTAIVEAGAFLGSEVEIGAYAYVGGKVVLGDGCRLHHHACVEGYTVIGKDNEIFPFALIGGRTQDKKWNGDESRTEIGDRNIFREYSTLHPATFTGRQTLIGSDNLFCAYSHIGHESHVGSHVIFSNNATLGGHVEVGDRVVIGGLTAVHQFCKIGEGVMIGGCCKVLQDVLPFMLAEGYPATHRTINKVGMERSGYNEESVKTALKIFKLFFKKGLNRTQALGQMCETGLHETEVGKKVMQFLETSTRGLA